MHGMTTSQDRSKLRCRSGAMAISVIRAFAKQDLVRLFVPSCTPLNPLLWLRATTGWHVSECRTTKTRTCQAKSSNHIFEKLRRALLEDSLFLHYDFRRWGVRSSLRKNARSCQMPPPMRFQGSHSLQRAACPAGTGGCTSCLAQLREQLCRFRTSWSPLSKTELTAVFPEFAEFAQSRHFIKSRTSFEFISSGSEASRRSCHPPLTRHSNLGRPPRS